MSHIERRATYFEAPGRQNTDALLKTAREHAEKTGVRDIVVASTTGETGVAASKLFEGFNLVVVTHHTGFSTPGAQEMSEDNRQKILASGARVLTATHALSSVERAVRKEFGTIGTLEIIANTLRLFGEGTKVCVEIALMATDAGFIPNDRDIIAIAGSGRGADTALLIRPANTSRFFDLEVREVIAKPRRLEK
jgi:hypothetical protein